MDSIILIGPRGSGKTSVGKEISLIMDDIKFIDADEEFIRLHGPIKDIVDKKGWPEFRRLESALLINICKNNEKYKIVLAVGGGAVAHNQGEEYRARNVTTLKEFGNIFYLLPYKDLNQSARMLTERINKDPFSKKGRPQLKDCKSPFEEMLLTLKERHPIYSDPNVRDWIIYTKNNTPYQIAKVIRDEILL